MRKDVHPTFAWTDKMQTAMSTLINRLTSQPALALPDPTKPFTVLADVSDTAVGALLRQDHVVASDLVLLDKHQR